MSENLISIIIPAKNCEATIEKCLNSLLNLEYRNYEVIVIDDASSDRTCEIIAKFTPKIKIITNKSCTGPSKARNDAVLIARGEYLAFTDSDCIVDRDWLNQLMKGFNSFPDVAGCGGVQLLPWDAKNFEKKAFLLMQKVGFISDYMRSVKSSDVIEVKHNASCCVMYRKDVFLKNRGFLEGLWPGEDVEFDFRLKKQGIKLFFNPKAVVYHYRPDDLKKFCRMMYRYGLAQGFLVRKYGIFRRVQIVPLATVTFVLMILFLGFWNSWKMAITFIILLIIGLLIYLALNLFLFTLGIIGIMAWHIGYFRGIIKKYLKINNKMETRKIISAYKSK